MNLANSLNLLKLYSLYKIYKKNYFDPKGIATNILPYYTASI